MRFADTKPFTSTLLEEEREEKEKKEGVTFTVRLNRKEWLELQEDKELLDTPADSTALKALAEIGRNVLHTQLSGPTLARLFKKDRVRK